MDEGATLGMAAKTAGEAASAALGWLAAPANRTLVGTHAARVERELRVGALVSKRLAAAAARPMAVAVFGASQVGKSHLISVLARKGEATLVRFPGMPEPVDYIARINPDRGKEATGLVTRFTVQAGTPGPAGFPVRLRLLGHADVVKILANAYFFDGLPGRYETWPERDGIEAFLAPFRDAPRGVAAGNGLTAEDVWDLEDYFKAQLGEFELTRRLGPFWHLAAEIVPALPLPRLAEFFSLLWGRHSAITGVYLALAAALERLGFADEAFAPFSAIDLQEAGAPSILDVEALSGINDADAPRLELRTAGGGGAELPRPVVTALTAELVMVLAEKPWDFFGHTDLLDFPGYRPRGLPQASEAEEADGARGLARHLAEAPRETLSALILRGKVEYLFQRYAAEQEVTAMLLCVKESNLDVAQLPDVVAAWVATTHGARPADRIGKPPLLFFVFTRFDMHFEKKTSDGAMGLSTRFEGRMLASLLKPFGTNPDGWARQWTPGTPFRNTFLMRNPNVQNGDIFVLEGRRELAVRPDRTDWVAALREGFASAPHVAEHFADPRLAFDEMMRLDDGGARRLAESIAPVCDPAAKARQIAFRLDRLVSTLALTLKPFHTETDLDKRLAERTALAAEVGEALYRCGEERGRFGTLLGGLMIDSGAIADRLYETTMTLDRSPAAEPGPARRPRPWETGSATPATPAAAPARGPEAALARAAVTEWTEHLYACAAEAPFAREVGLSPEHLREVVDEIVAAARRLDVAGKLGAAIRRIAFRDRRDDEIAKATLAAERLLNGFVADLGISLLPPERRALNRLAEPPRAVFEPLPLAFDADGIGPEPAPHALRFLDDWVTAYVQTARDNALDADGLAVDPAENARLGAVLATLERIRPEATDR